MHDITYVYSLQKTGKDQYTLVARNSDRKLVTGLPDSSKGRDEDFLVITGNWQNPIVNCPLAPGVPGFGRSIYLLRIAFLILFPLHWLSSFFFFSLFFLDKQFTVKKIQFVERKAVEHILKKPCFIDSGGRPREASILLGYEPSYNSFKKGPTVKHFRQEEITVARPGKDQEEILEAVPVTVRRGVQVPQLVPPLTDPNFVPSLEPSKVGDLVIRFPTLFNPTHQTEEEMPVQKRSINIGTVLGTSIPQSSETSPLPPPLGFSQGEDVMRRKRSRKEAEDEENEGGRESSPAQPLKKKPSSKKGKGKSARDLQ